MAAPTDEELAASAARGDKQATEALIRRFLKPVHSLCWRIVRDPALAEDATQETLLAAFRKLDTYRPDQRFSSWILTIATRTSYNMVRTRRRMRQYEGDVRPAPGPDDAAAALELQEAVVSLETAIEELPERDSLALYMRFHQDLTNDEIAVALDLQPGTVRVLLCRALARLHTRLPKESVS